MTTLPHQSSEDLYHHIADHVIKRRWYCTQWGLAIVGFSFGVTLCLTFIFLDIPSNPLLSIAALVAAIVGYIGDTAATKRLMRWKKEFDKLGQEFPVYEVGLFLPKHPTVKDLHFGTNAAINLLLLIPAYLLPYFGFTTLVMRFLAVVTNLRQENRVKLVLKLLKSQSE